MEEGKKRLSKWCEILKKCVSGVISNPSAVLAFLLSSALTFAVMEKIERNKQITKQELTQGQKTASTAEQTVATSIASQPEQLKQLQPPLLRLSCDLIAVQPPRSHE
ncbi:hypothetical protein ACMFLR_18950 [Delftia tsuruhatensis]|uniref:hypothetical protein n=1 Tax=Delftia tsuruhatensis TaxID=180282 RepID=UPI00244D20D0|nr:hypothetical protein [Delftia tsuruhatensis]MDH0423609.1 hypothetical protein [Delftia tsuruhatensis]